MRFTDVFIRRPVLAIVINLLILIGGLQAIRSLNVRQYPKIESATVVVKTVYVGANADLVRGFITTPLERSIAAADGIDYIESESVQGMSTINVRLKLNFDAAKALAESRDFGAPWRDSDAPLVAWQYIAKSDHLSSSRWRLLWLAHGFQTVVRVEFSLPAGRAFECFMFSPRELNTALLSTFDDSLCDGVLRVVLQRSGERQRVILRQAVNGSDMHDAKLAPRKSSRLVEEDCVQVSRFLESTPVAHE
jgi:hypothetical protein